MPVRLQSQTEYGRQFEHTVDPNNPPLPDFYKPPSQKVSQEKAVTAEPPLQHKKKAMVIPEHMPQVYRSLEPPIQRKKKPVIPHGSNPVKFTENGNELWKSGEEYVLLGNQDKFSNNVKYKAKPLNVSVAVAEPVVEKVKTPNAPRPKPAPRVVVDTGAPNQHQKPDNDIQPQGKKPKLQDKPKSNYTDQNRSPPKPKPSDAEPRERSRPRDPRPKVNNSEVIQKQSPAKDNKQNGVAPAEEEATADYAMKYRAGIAPPRRPGPKRLSEYQMQYEWKNRTASSPMLDAEQVVYKSSTQLVPRKAKFHSATEYSKQFQPWESVPGPIAPKPGGKPSLSKAKLPRSKSVGEISPDRREPAGLTKVVSDDNRRLVQESMNPLRIQFPHGPQKAYSSEYAANFASPQVFEYEQGAWKGANPPHLQADKERDTQLHDRKSRPIRSSTAEPPVLSNEGFSTQVASSASETSWYKEVLELRKRAEEYKRRSHGTHFSRQHLAQLLAQQAEMWDTESQSSVLSALALETPKLKEPRIQEKKSDKNVSKNNAVAAPPAGRKTAWGQDRIPLSSRDDSESVQSYSVAANFDEQTRRSDISDAPEFADVEDYDSSDTLTPDGRVPTAKMADKNRQRHHLDRTTPVNGALLSSPPQHKGKMQKGQRDGSSSASSIQDFDLPSKNKASISATAPGTSQTSQSVNKLKKIYGMPTRDAHPLLDDTASTDRPLATQYVYSPSKGNKNREKFPGVDVPATIQEASADTYNAQKHTSVGKKLKFPGNEITLAEIPPRSYDDDVLSLSARSIASSCSLASEVLSRARSRRDEFWGNQ